MRAAVASCATSASRVAAVCGPGRLLVEPVELGLRAADVERLEAPVHVVAPARDLPGLLDAVLQAGADVGEVDAERAVRRAPRRCGRTGPAPTARSGRSAATAPGGERVDAAPRFSPRGTAAATRPPQATTARPMAPGMPSPATRPTAAPDAGQDDAERRRHGLGHRRREEPVAERARHQPREAIRWCLAERGTHSRWPRPPAPGAVLRREEWGGGFQGGRVSLPPLPLEVGDHRGEDLVDGGRVAGVVERAVGGLGDRAAASRGRRPVRSRWGTPGPACRSRPHCPRRSRISWSSWSASSFWSPSSLRRRSAARRR